MLLKCTISSTRNCKRKNERSFLRNTSLIIYNTIVLWILVEILQPIVVLCKVTLPVPLHLLLQNVSVLAVVVARLLVRVVVLVVRADGSHLQPTPPHQRALYSQNNRKRKLDMSSTDWSLGIFCPAAFRTPYHTLRLEARRNNHSRKSQNQPYAL